MSKHCITYQNGVQVAEKTVTFVWDGWDLLYERHQLPSGLTTLERKYLWGPDLADGAAGGAGGLLLIGETKGNTTTNYIPIYDGTGHVVALTDINKNLHATYAYGPFGEKIYAAGDKANSNPWRWATKYLDEETGLYYFGHRFYDPITGQWLSREPLGESESVNLYAYCGNDPVNKVDVLGMFKTQVQADEFRTRMLLAQIIEDLTRIPTEPSKEISNGDFFPYLPNVEEFGVFKPYTQADYDRAEVEIEKITTANMSGGSIYPISEQQANDMAWASAGGEWNPLATAALTLGAANTQFNANINSGFLLPAGGAGFALKGLQGTRALTALNTAAPLLKNASLGNFTYHASVRTLNSGGYQAIYGRLQTMRASPYDPRLQRSLYDDCINHCPANELKEHNMSIQ